MRMLTLIAFLICAFIQNKMGSKYAVVLRRHINVQSLVIGVILLIGLICFPVSVTQAQTHERILRTLTVDGIERKFSVYLPAASDPHSGKTPVIIFFHPALATIDGMETQVGLQTHPWAKKFMIVYPQGIGKTWNDGECCGQAFRQNVQDTLFFEAIVNDLKTVADIDDKVFVAGWSNGARFVYRLICDKSDLLSGAVTFGASIQFNDTGCASQTAIPLIHIHGTEDVQAPIQGGIPQGPMSKLFFDEDSPLNVPPHIQAVRFLAQKYSCKTQTKQKVPLLKTDCDAWKACDNNSEVMFCPIERLGHTWPGAKASHRMFGPERLDVHGNAQTLKFFLEILQKNKK